MIRTILAENQIGTPLGGHYMCFSPRTAMMAVALILSLSCDKTPEPLGPERGSTSDVTALMAMGGTATGHAVVQGTPVQNVLDQRYSFSAVSTDVFPTAMGQVDVHYVRFTGQELRVHADVTCLSVVGDQAWVGAEISRLVVDGAALPDFVGAPMIFRVLDVGEDENATDLASLVSFPGPGGDIAHCTTRPDFPILRESTIGNIQVQGGVD
jgi:hypothetical protein